MDINKIEAVINMDENSDSFLDQEIEFPEVESSTSGGMFQNWSGIPEDEKTRLTDLIMNDPERQKFNESVKRIMNTPPSKFIMR